MPRRKREAAYNVETLQEKAEKAVAEAPPGFAGSCQYLGVVADDGSCNLAAKLTARCQVAFEWLAHGPGGQASITKKLRCDSVYDRGVPFPDEWKVPVQCGVLSEKVQQAIEGARDKAPMSNVECMALGLPKPAELGRVVELQEDGGERVDYLLCAQVDDDHWWCHKGGIDDDDPFAEAGLVLKDVLRDAWEPAGAPAPKRARKLLGPQLRGLVRKRPWSWARAR